MIVPQNQIYVTGDIHGEIDIGKLDTKNFQAAKKLSKNDYLIVAGDFGLPWSGNRANTMVHHLESRIRKAG